MITSGQALAKTAGYRPEIQGLRAVASLLVATYHIWFSRVSGGVDVFFAVSGFLITSTLLRQIDTTGRIDFLKFWGGMARRLLPTAMLVLVTIAVASVIWLPRPLWDETIRQTVASIFYVENWQAAFATFGSRLELERDSPVQHYWALSVQGQFYLLWPIVVASSVALAARFGAGARITLARVIAALFLVSFALSIVATRHNQPFTYFATPARLWEFCLGALCAVLPNVNLRTEVRVVFSWVGLVGIIACGAIFQVSEAFPGYAALLPVCCAVLIVLAGTSGSAFGADRLLVSRPLVYLGGISYGIYLWHWPVLIFYRWFNDQAPIELIDGLGVLTASIVLAAISTRFLENPLRFSQGSFAKTRDLTAFVVRASSPALLVSLVWGGYFLQQKTHDERPIAVEDPDYPGALALEAGYQFKGRPGAPIYPGMLAVFDDPPVTPQDACYRSNPDRRGHGLDCAYGDRSSSRTLALVGPHSAHWLPALELIAKTHGWRIVMYTRRKCLFSDETEEIEQDLRCKQWNEHTLKILLEDRPEVVFTTATHGSGAQDHVPSGFLSRWDQLHAAGISVVAIRDTPWMRFWVPECVDRKGRDSPSCAQTTANMLASTSPLHDVGERSPNVNFIDMSEYFCNEAICPL